MDRAVFAVVSSVCVMALLKEHPEWNGRKIKRIAKPRYLKMLQETPQIGSYKDNCLKICLAGGAVWFSIYETVEALYGKMSDELYGRMCNATYSIPIMGRKYRKMPFFDARFQDKYAAKMEKVLKCKKGLLISLPCVLPPAGYVLWLSVPGIRTSCPLCARPTTQ